MTNMMEQVSIHEAKAKLSANAPVLSSQVRTAIDRADAVSAISAWEISLKVARETVECRPARRPHRSLGPAT